ncbi:MAG: hypothetical protein ACE37F_26940 [Nannocystaceae bacterium]|nr:hypothetical protein [bacterium]
MPRVLATPLLLLLVAGSACDDATGDAAAGPAKPEVTLSAEQVRARLKVADANLEMGGTEANGLRVQSLSCANAKRPLLEGMAMVGGFAEHKAALDACAPKGAAVVVTWKGASGALSELDVYSGRGASVDACVSEALASAKSPLAGPCAGVLMLGEAAGADAAAAAWIDENADGGAS